MITRRNTALGFVTIMFLAAIATTLLFGLWQIKALQPILVAVLILAAGIVLAFFVFICWTGSSTKVYNLHESSNAPDKVEKAS